MYSKQGEAACANGGESQRFVVKEEGGEKGKVSEGKLRRQFRAQACVKKATSFSSLSLSLSLPLSYENGEEDWVFPRLSLPLLPHFCLLFFPFFGEESRIRDVWWQPPSSPHYQGISGGERKGISFRILLSTPFSPFRPLPPPATHRS